MRGVTPLFVTVSIAAGCAPGARAQPTAPPSCTVDACAPGPSTNPPCPVEMVLIGERFCIDRYEAAMVDEGTGRLFSPYYPPTRDELRKAVNGQKWGLAALGKQRIEPEVPLLPDWERASATRARAVSRAGLTPQGYVSKMSAAAACGAASKRLCKLEEWSMACRGEQNTPFPYGNQYQPGSCNVRIRHHPAAILYGDASAGHWDPRLNFMRVEGAPLLKATGAIGSCKSSWGVDAVYDMVGNIDEWVEDGKGTFAGGFYARDTTRGCDARVSEHGPTYFDYSTGVRCCADRAR